MVGNSTENIVNNDNLNNGSADSIHNLEIDEENCKKKPEFFMGRTKQTVVKFFFKLLIYLLLWVYFSSATYYFFDRTDGSFSDTSCTGYGFLVILFAFIQFGIVYSLILRPFVLPILYKKLWKPCVQFLSKIKYISIISYIVVAILIVIYLIFDTNDDRTRLIPIGGLALFILIGFLISSDKKKIPWHTVIMGLFLQFVFGLLTIRWDVGRNVFDCAGDKVNTFLGYAVNGSAFVYGDFLVFEKAVFAFQALATIYFLGLMINILYYYGIMQNVVASLGQFLQFTMGTTICESVNSAANIFLGQSEAPLLLKPYLVHMTDSEIHSIMTSGFATVSGTVLAAYISFGANPAHLITASVMSAPAALCYSKLIYPETEEIRATKEIIKNVEGGFDSVLDAASKGAQDANKVILGIISNLIAFIAFVYFINGVLSWMGALVGFTDESELWTIDLILGKVFIPVSYVMGVPWEDCEKVGQLIGIKTMVNEFAAFAKMSTMDLLEKSKVIATYSICGFSNPGSIGIMVSALGTLVPSKRETVTRLVFRAFLGGAIACLMTACIAGILISTN